MFTDKKLSKALASFPSKCKAKFSKAFSSSKSKPSKTAIKKNAMPPSMEAPGSSSLLKPVKRIELRDSRVSAPSDSDPVLLSHPRPIPGETRTTPVAWNQSDLMAKIRGPNPATPAQVSELMAKIQGSKNDSQLPLGSPGSSSVKPVIPIPGETRTTPVAWNNHPPAIPPQNTKMSDEERSSHFLSSADIIPPQNLEGMERNRDYILLRHDPKRDSASIFKDGLLSLRGLVEGPHATEDDKKRFSLRNSSHYFMDDHNLIYFKPVDSNVDRINLNDIVVAVSPEARIYDKENRIGGNKWEYFSSEMKAGEYCSLLESKSENTFINRFKKVQQGAPEDRKIPGDLTSRTEKYYPEVPIHADKIPPDQFVPHEAIDPLLRRMG